MNLHSCVQLAALLLHIGSIPYLAQAQEFIPPEFLTQATRSPSASLLDEDTPCIEPCDSGFPDITPSILQKCVDLCEEVGHCCGNRLAGEVEGSAAERLSCANGCEMAYYSTNVGQCKQSCSAGFGNGCEYDHPYINKPFALCWNCREGCQGWPSDDACDDGCDFATTLDEFYKFEEPNDTCNPADIPRFLFGGQSNMEGNSAEAMGDQLVKMINIINSKKIKNVRRKKLKNVINDAKEAEVGASKHMRNLLWRMKRRLKTVLDPPDIGAVCSYTNPSYMKRLDCERPVTPNVCNANGHGPELMFAHHFPTLNTKYKRQTIGITKVAVGGTIIKQWMKQYSSEANNYWDTLVDAIHGSGGTMEGFVWFQGENDHFYEKGNEEEKGKYQERLTQFVSDVREEIYQTSSKFQSKDDIPVVIVELGEWIRGMGGTGPDSIIAAQRAYVDSDPNSILVSSGSSENPNKRLSKFYHFDAASQLIIGHRVAKALATLLKS